MKTLQSSQAKAHFSELLDAVERGETIRITRHGRVVAVLKPGEDEAALRAEAFRMFDKRRGSLTGMRLSVDDILSARDEGRRP